jgi:quinoprotein glucose dehydrogenase
MACRFGVTLNPFLSPFGLPCKQAAWGYISALDLKTNQVVWKKRIGTPQDSMPFPMPVPVPFNMGMPMLGGPISTAGNVLFIAATADNYLRAYNMSNGEKLWQGRLPAGGQATPMTYEVNGKQYVVISAGGHGSFGTKMGIYRLPTPCRTRKGTVPSDCKAKRQRKLPFLMSAPGMNREHG